MTKSKTSQLRRSAALPSMAGASGDENPFKPRPLFWAIFLAGVIVRLCFLDEPYRGDETYTFLNFAIRPLSFIVTDYHLPNNHILHSILMHFCFLLFKGSAIYWRLPVFLFGLFQIYGVYVLARLAVRQHTVAWLAALAVAVSHAAIYYSTNARGYSIQIALALAMAITAFWRWPWERWYRYITILPLLGFALLYTVPTGVVFILPFYLFLWRFPPEGLSEVRAKIALVMAVTFSLTLAAYWPVFDQMVANSKFDYVPAWRVFWEAVTEASEGLGSPLILSAASLAGLVFLAPQRRLQLFFSYVLLAFFALTLLLHPIAYPVVTFGRSYTPLYPFAYLVCAYAFVEGTRRLRGSESLWKKYLGCGLAALLWAGSSMSVLLHGARIHLNKEELFYPTREVRRQAQRTTRRLAARLLPDERILGRGACDEQGAIYTIEKHGMSSWWIWRLYTQPVRTLYVVSDQDADFEEFYNTFLDPRLWTPPSRRPHGNSVVVYQAKRRFDRPLPDRIQGFVN